MELGETVPIRPYAKPVIIPAFQEIISLREFQPFQRARRKEDQTTTALYCIGIVHIVVKWDIVIPWKNRFFVLLMLSGTSTLNAGLIGIPSGLMAIPIHDSLPIELASQSDSVSRVR